jgi:uncharacterized protein YaaR (DUF327 family)
MEIAKTEQSKLQKDYKLRPKKSGASASDGIQERSTSFLDEMMLCDLNPEMMEDAPFNSLVAELDQQSRRFLQKPVVEELVKYRTLVKKFLDKTVHGALVCEKKEGRTIRNRQTGNMQSLPPTKLVKIIDEKLNELSLLIINQQAKAINLAARLSEIRGLLLDLRG